MDLNLPSGNNINWAAAASAIATIFAYLCPGIPDNVRTAILLLVGIVFVLAITVLHNVFNKPAVAAAAKAYALKASNASVTAGRVVAPLFLVFLMLPLLFLAGCANNPLTGDDPQETVFNWGTAMVGPLQTVSLLSQTGAVPLPKPLCTGALAGVTAFQGAENTVRSPNFTDGDAEQQVLTAADNVILTAVSILAEIAASNHALVAKPPAKATLLVSDPTDAQWATLNSQLNSAIVGIKCAG